MGLLRGPVSPATPAAQEQQSAALAFFGGLAGSGYMGTGIARVQSPPLGRIARPCERESGRFFILQAW